MKRKIIVSIVVLLLSTNSWSQAIEIYEQFLGKYDFTMIGNTLNPADNSVNSSFCSILTSSSATLSLTPQQNIHAAYLYWSGSGSLAQADLNVKLNGNDISAERTFTLNMGPLSLPVFSAFADVTTIVQNIGNGNYTLSDLDLTAIISPYCQINGGGGANYGGWSIVIIYQDDSLTNNLVNVYDGFEKVDGNSGALIIELTNLNVLHIVGNKIGFLAWEGDRAIDNEEKLSINNILIDNPPLNPWNNAFNSTNSFTGSDELYNMDLDLYDINDYTEIGDNDLFVKLESGQDAVAVNNITLVLNSEVPDATISGNASIGGCDDRSINVDYTVYNTIATDVLPAGTPIAFYADTTLIGTSATVDEIPIGGSEDGMIGIIVPLGVPTQFNLIVKVDDDGTGTSTVIEFQEDNNTFEIPVILGVTPTVNNHDLVVEKCDTDDNQSELFNLTLVGNQMLGAQTGVTIRYYTDENDAIAGNANNITTPNAFTNTGTPQTIYVRMEDVVGCFIIAQFDLNIIPAAAMEHEIPDLVRCSSQEILTGVVFDLSENETSILNGNDPATHTISYHISENEARSGANPILNFANYPNVTSPETIWVRMINDTSGCVEFGSFEISTTAPDAMTYDLPNLEHCSSNHILVGISFDLTENATAILNGNDPDDFNITYHLSMEDAINGTGTIANETNYPNISSPQTIWARMIDAEGCVKYGSFELIAIAAGEMVHQIPELENCSSDQILIGILTDLTENETEVLNGNDPNQFTITYHLTQNDAINGTAAIADPENYLNISAPQTIWVRMVSLLGCAQYGSFELVYHAAPIAQNSPYEECSMHGPALFDLTGINELIVANTTGLDFTYYLTLNDANNGTNPLPTNYTPPTQNSTIFVRVLNEFGCFSVVEAELITIINTTTINDTYFECDSPWEVSDGIGIFDLSSINNQVNMQLGLPDSNISYHLSSQDAATGANPVQNPTQYLNTSNPEIIYARALELDGNCGGVAEFRIEVLPVPVFELPDYLAFCNYDEKSYEFLDPFTQYTWTDASGNVVSNESLVNFTQEGIYTLEVISDENDCPALREIEIIFDNQPIITNIDVNEHTVTISAQGGLPPYEYSINNGLTWTDDYIIQNVPGGIYDLIVRSKYGCISSAKTFGVLGIPNLITPNGDGKNDYWEIRGLEAYPNAFIKIFDRYGKIFVERPLTTDFRWDGKYLGIPVPSGDYWYIITVEEGKSISGHISVRNRN